MKRVIDSNFLQRSELRSHLEKSINNKAVLTDYIAMEAYKGDGVKSIGKSMEILCEFPRQIIVLKSTINICQLSGRLAGLQRRLIDQEQTRSFSLFCNGLERLSKGGKMQWALS